MIVIDTNVASELMKPSPDVAVREWIRAHRGDRLHTTSVTIAEIRYGIERLPAGRRREQLKADANELFASFQEQILPFDAEAAAFYPAVLTRRDRAGLPIDGFDAQIAAICHLHGASLATRNIKDFRDTDLDLIDPWRG